MWLGQTAIPPIAPYARVSERVITEIVGAFSPNGEIDENVIREQLTRLRTAQPILEKRAMQRLATRRMDESVRAVGIFLSLSIWLSFEHMAVHGLCTISAEAWDYAEQILKLDENLRQRDPGALFESDDVIAAHQPDIAVFARERIQEAIQQSDGSIVDEMDAIYRLVLVEVLALSYAVRPPPNRLPDSVDAPS